MLPFLKNKQKSVAGLIVQHRAPDEKPEENQDDNMDHDEAIKACARDLIEGVKSENVHKVAEAFRSAFEILEIMPHDEVDHEEDNSFAGHNAAAAKEQE